MIKNFEKASNIHHNIKDKLLKMLEGSSIHNGSILCSFIENQIKNNSNDTEVHNGIAFPVGINKNNIVAHYTPIPNDDVDIDLEHDIIKIDYGVHNDGYIIDEAFSYTKNPELQKLIDASKEALEAQIKNARPDVKISTLGQIAEEIVRSYEYEIKPGTIVPLLPINNVCGHSIKRWNIHGEKLIYNVSNSNNNVIESGDQLALEVYVSNGMGTSYMDTNHISHYMLNKYEKGEDLFIDKIYNIFNTLAFSPQRHFEGTFEDSTLFTKYPIIKELNNNAKVSQTEKTMLVQESSTIVF
tara:strand:+ start:4742 stop:5635 length:894 start_codon:yes stop_codon:yes gene_type:complete